MARHPADDEALRRMLAVAPEWRGLGTASSVAGCARDVLLHAGPAFEAPARITAPILNSACVAAVYEGLASGFDDARRAVLAGEVRLLPAQDHGVVTPLASVVSASMPLQVVCDRRAPGRAAYAPLNGGSGPAMRLGMCSDAVLSHLRWLNGEFADAIGRELPEPVDLIDVARQALARGDDCHGRTPAATAIVAERLADCSGLSPAMVDFLDHGPSFFLNLWMAACRCMLAAAAGVEGGSLVVAAGGNGASTGIQLAGLPGRWFVARAETPKGRFDDDAIPASRGLGAIGDSAIVDALGFGAMAMRFAPEQRKNLEAFMPPDGLALPDGLLCAVHPGFGDLGVRVGMLAREVAARGQPPVVSLGVLDREGVLGRLGGGIYRPPLALFEEAVAELDRG